MYNSDNGDEKEPSPTKSSPNMKQKLKGHRSSRSTIAPTRISDNYASQIKRI